MRCSSPIRDSANGWRQGTTSLKFCAGSKSVKANVGERFRLLWTGEKDAVPLARLVTKIRGSKVYPDAAYLPSSKFEEVEDFVEAHGFTLTDGARELISQERRTKSLRMVGVDPGPASPPKEKQRIKTASGEIDASLLDDINDIA